jgi:Zn-dependent protease
MRWSVRMFSVFGIEVRVHASFLFIVAYFAFIWGVVRRPGGVSGALYGVLLVVLLFFLVVVHELSHSRVAQSYGINVRSITLLPIGGVSSMDEIPEDPRKELVISAAGPLSNLILGLLMLAGAFALFPAADFTHYGRLLDFFVTPSVEGTYLYLMVVNFTLALFNLLPAFPMDGGRVFRAFLAFRMGRARASRVAVVVGQGLALGMGFLGIFSGNIFLLLVAVFIFFGAQGESAGDQVRQTLGDLRVSQAVNVHVEYARPDQVIGQLATTLFHSYQTDFPVVYGERVLGLVTRDRLISTLAEKGVDFPVTEAMARDFPVADLHESVYDAFLRMRLQRFKAVPVMDGDRFVGMLSVEDISEVYALLSAAGPEFAHRVPDEGEVAAEDDADLPDDAGPQDEA